MSPEGSPLLEADTGFPRSRGDEPEQGYVQIVDEEFSPLTRG